MPEVTRKEVTSRVLRGFGPSEVSEVLGKGRHCLSDLPALLSPAAVHFVGYMKQLARRNKLMHFGRTVKLYTPLYISNYCSNHCLYCGFNANSPGGRRRLSPDELLEEGAAIRASGIDSILIVSGEDPEYLTPEFLKSAVAGLKRIFSYVAAEIYPLSPDVYKDLFAAGLDGLTLYQETYDRETYARMHPAGSKGDYDARLSFMDAAASAGFRTLGLGVLLGLHDWRLDSLSLAAHAEKLRRRFWTSKIQFSFPRITDAACGFSEPCPVSEADLEQMVLAFRIVFPECEISISTRESAEFRDKIASTAATVISAGSKVVPGGYASCPTKDIGQFSLHDTRSVAEIDTALKTLGLDPVYKDWDSILARA
ncbi:MAG: 2-iminoacetate synthase ThiH [Victivallales bacterium]|nr:2-iminoacetate synthase ThiH [Victivallales bacterium]